MGFGAVFGGFAVALQSGPSVALKKLADASGDDIRGIASEGAAVPLLPESAYWIGCGFREWLGSDGEITVGRDPRLSSASISEAVCRGASARDAGAATTPAMLECLQGHARVLQRIFNFF